LQTCMSGYYSTFPPRIVSISSQVSAVSDWFKDEKSSPAAVKNSSAVPLPAPACFFFSLYPSLSPSLPLPPLSPSLSPYLAPSLLPSLSPTPFLPLSLPLLFPLSLTPPSLPPFSSYRSSHTFVRSHASPGSQTSGTLTMYKMSLIVHHTLM